MVAFSHAGIAVEIGSVAVLPRSIDADLGSRGTGLLVGLKPPNLTPRGTPSNDKF
jgi:hypothetical protein